MPSPATQAGRRYVFTGRRIVDRRRPPWAAAFADRLDGLPNLARWVAFDAAQAWDNGELVALSESRVRRLEVELVGSKKELEDAEDVLFALIADLKAYAGTFVPVIFTVVDVQVGSV